MSVIHMHEYLDEAKAARSALVRDRKETIHWDDHLFRLHSGGYLDRADKPLFKTTHSLSPVRQDVLNAMPDEKRRGGLRKLAFDQVFMPFVQDADPFWIGGVDKGAFNQSYAPYAVLYYVLREHPEEFRHLVDGTYIENGSDYHSLLDQFNRVFHRVLIGRGRGAIRGYCSTDEMIRMGTLFYLLQLSCDHSEGLVLDDERRFANNWGKEPVKVELAPKTVSQYGRKLENVVMSDMAWHQFMYRYVPLTDARTMWFFNVPKFMDSNYDTESDGSVHQWFTQQDFMVLIDLLPAITNRGGLALCMVRGGDEFVADAHRLFKFDNQITDSVYKSTSGLYLNANFARGYHEYTAISNYLLP
jgi:hypothetical protein